MEAQERWQQGAAHSKQESAPNSTSPSSCRSSSSDDNGSTSSDDSATRSKDPSNLANSLLVGQQPISPATSAGSGGTDAVKSISSTADLDAEIAAEVAVRRGRKASRRNSAISYDASDAQKSADPPPTSKAPRLTYSEERELSGETDFVRKEFENAKTTRESGNQESNRRPTFNAAKLDDGEHIDIATYPTSQLLHLLASLLQHIAAANDGFRASTTIESGLTGVMQKERQSAAARAKQPEMAKPSLTRVTPYYTPNSPSATRSSSSSLGDYFSLKPRSGSSSFENLRKIPTSLAMSTNQDTSSNAEASTSALPEQQEDDVNTEAEVDCDDGIMDIDLVTTASKVAYISRNATLCFHARNIPGIGIEQYLQRILKYCPTTNEVFIALLVYFDRMAKFSTAQARNRRDDNPPLDSSHSRTPIFNTTHTPTSTHPQDSTRFAVDSFNIHRLLIAGLTVASKFFSDVFYTNSRYAKVGGLPLTELNSLELQFLLLNDFSLQIDLEEIQRYADMLCLHWAQSASDLADYQQMPFQTWRSERPSADTLERQDGVSLHPGNSSKNENIASSSPLRPAFARFYSERASSESDTSTLTGRSDSSSVCSTGTITYAESADPTSTSVESIEHGAMDVDV